MTSAKLIKKLEARKKKIKERSQGGNMIYFKADETTRLRILPHPEDQEFGMEVVHFYLGSDIKGVISPASFGEPCAIMEAYERLNSGDEDDKSLAATFKPKSRYVVAVIKYKDIKGKEIEESGVKMPLLTAGQYQDLIDYYLDPEKGDFTDKNEGYDIKFSRSGSGKYDTEYSTMDCKPTKLDKKYSKQIYNVEDIVRTEIPDYEKTEEYISSFLGMGADDDEDERPKKKKKKTSLKGKTSTKEKLVVKGKKKKTSKKTSDL